ncbi:MAG: hypothetical protein HY774_02685 [Acidobacteria bacterium]|nr:hypothetical protein [Acidobacteriota bacterium]
MNFSDGRKAGSVESFEKRGMRLDATLFIGTIKERLSQSKFHQVFQVAEIQSPRKKELLLSLISSSSEKINNFMLIRISMSGISTDCTGKLYPFECFSIFHHTGF